MSTAELGITVTSSGVAQAVADLDKLTPAAARAEQAVTKLTATTTTQLTQAANQAESMAKRIERALNIKPVGIDMGRGADIAAYGAELDRLRAKFNQAHSIMQSYRVAANEIRQANSVGAISINEMSVAMERLRVSTQRQIDSERLLRQGRQVGGGGTPGRGAPGGGAQQMMQSNLMYQFQDVAVTAAMGMNPVMIALQQGTQIGAAMTAAGGAKAGIAGLTGALTSMLSVTNLLPIAVIGVGAAMYQWLTGADEKVKSVDELIKEHTKSVEALAKMYGVAGVSAADYGSQSSLAIQAAEQRQRAAIKERATDANNALFGIGDAGGGPLGNMADMGGGRRVLALADENFEPFRAALEEFQKSVEEGAPDFESLYKNIDAVATASGNANPEIDKTRQAIYEATEEAAKYNTQLGITTEKMMDLAEAQLKLTIERQNAVTDLERLVAASKQAEFDNSAEKGVSTAARERAVELAVTKEQAAIDKERNNLFKERERSMENSIRQEKENLIAMNLSGAALETYKQTAAEVHAIEDAARKAGIDAGTAAYESYQKQIDKAKEYGAELFEILKQEEALTRTRTSAQNDAAISAMFARTNAERIAAAGGSAGAGKVPGAQTDFEVGEAKRLESARIQKEMADADRSRQQNLESLLKTQELEISLLGKTAGEQAALREEFRLTEELKRDAAERGIEVDQAQLKAIQETTAAYGERVDMLNQMRIVQDLAFERSLLYLSQEEAALARRLRGTGISTNSDIANEMRAQEAEKNAIDFARSTAKDFLGGFADVLVEGGEDMGENLVKALVGSAQRALDKILDSLLDSLVNSLIGGMGGGAGGGGGGILGNALSSLLGGGGGGGGGNFGTAGGFASMLNNGSAAVATNVAGNGVNTAMSLLGTSENTAGGLAAINAYLQKGGVDLNAASNAWCAAFVNSSLKQIGVEGSGSNMASSFLNWGQKVDPSGVMAGDVLVRGIPGQTGGHVGLATGASRMSGGVNQLEMISGNTGGAGLGTGGVGKDWVSSQTYELRRATEGMTKSVEDMTAGATKSALSLMGLSGVSNQTVNSLSGLMGGFQNFASSMQSFMASASGGGSSWFQGLMGSFGGAGGALNFMSGISPGATAAILGAGGGFVGLFHEGNLGGSSRSRHFPSMEPWADAVRLHKGNMFGAGEYPAVLKKGEPVFPNVEAAAKFGGSKMLVNVNNFAGVKVRTEEKQTSEGITLEVMLDRMVASAMDTRGSAANNTLRNKFGINERLRAR